MEKAQRRILRSPSVKRKSKVLPIGQRLTLERVLGLTVSSNAALSCDPVNGTIAYPAGCVVVLFNPRRNRQSHIFNVSKKTITSVAFSGDGKHLVTGECGHQPAVRVWDVEEKTQVAEFHGHKFGINCVAFSPNLKYIVSIGSQHDMMVNVWNWRTGNKVASNKVSCKVCAVAFSADSAGFVTVGNRHVKFWYLDISKSKINQTLPLQGRSGILGEQKNNFFCDVACGRGLSAGSTFVITQSGLLCEFNEKRLLDKWVELRSKSANCLTVGEDHIYVGCAEGVVRVFSASSLTFVTTLPHPHHLGVEVATATTSSDMICTKTDAKYPDTIAIAVDDDHKKVACIYNDHSLYVWDVLNVRRVGKAWSFLYHSGCIWAVEVYPRLENQQNGPLPPGSFITASSDDTIRVWNLESQMIETPDCKRNIYSSELLNVVYTDPSLSFLCDVAYNPAGATDKTDTTWEGKNGVRSIRVSPDGEHLASGDRQGNIRVYDLHRMEEIRSIEAHESDVVCLEYSFSKAGPRILASGSRDRLIHVFDVEQKYGLLQTLDDHSAAIQAVRFSDVDNKLRMLSCGSDKSLLFRNAALNPGFEFSLDQHLVSKATMYDMIIDPTQKFVATACQDRNIRVYNMGTGKQKKNYRGSVGDEGILLRVQLDPSGTYAATSCSDKNLSIVEFYTGELTATVIGHSEMATGLRFTNDLKHLISVSADGCIFVWRLPSDMTKTMRSRMEELGKMIHDEPVTSDLRREANLMPNPVSLDNTFQTQQHFPVMKENLSPGRILDAMKPAASLSDPSFPPATPTGKGTEPGAAQTSPLDYRFSIGQLPNWAKARFGDGTGDGADGNPDSLQPKGRWAQRFDQNLAFKSQLDLTQLEDDVDHQRNYHPSGDLHPTASMPDLRRETVVLSQHQLIKNIPIIDDDDETNVDDDEDFFPAYLKGKLTGTPVESDRSSSDHDDRRGSSRKTDPQNRRSDGAPGRRWGGRISQGNGETTNSFDLDDTEDIDSWSDTTEVIYPPSEPESMDTYASTFQVFAVDGGKVQSRQKSKRISALGVDDVDSESTDPVSLEDQEDEDANDDTLVTSTASTPSDERDFLPPRTPDKELFVKENFDSVTFSPMAMDKFAQQVATLERVAENDAASLPFSPRLSLSSRFLSRSHFGGATRLGGAASPRPDNWFDMNWRTGGLIQESPEKEDPPSPPTKLDDKEPSYPSPKVTQNSQALSGSGNSKARDKSPIPASPTRRVPTSSHNSSASHSSSPTSRDKRRSAGSGRQEEVNGTGNGTGPPLRQAPSYFRTTKSSRLKSASAGNLIKQAEAQTKLSGVNSSNTKTESGAKKRLGKGRLSSSRLAMYASTPDLARFENDEDEGTEKTLPATTSNLRNLSDLSLSVPDINCLEDPASTDSSSSSGTVSGSKDGVVSTRKPSPARMRSRLSLPPDSLGTELHLADGSQADAVSLDKKDSKLMPPPASKNLPPRMTQSSLLRRAVQVRKRSTSELTLEQAKSILLGNSGILGANQTSPEDESPVVSPPGQNSRKLANSTSSESSQRTLSSASSSTLHSVSSRTRSSSSHTNSTSSAVFDPTDSGGGGGDEFPDPVYTPASTLAVTEEIERTASELRRERERAAAAALGASRYDPPERDFPSRPKTPVHGGDVASVTSSTGVVHLTLKNNESKAVSPSDPAVVMDDNQELSVRERIALYNQSTPGRGSLDSGRSSSPVGMSPRTVRASMASPAPPDARVSPRSQSDTGLGSDTDTDSDLRQYHKGRLNDTGSSGASPPRPDRSRLSLQLQASEASPGAARTFSTGQDLMQTCTTVLTDLRTATQRAKDLHTQVQNSNTSVESRHQMMSMMSETFHETHLTLAQLALQSPVSSHDPPKPPCCPLVGEGTRADTSVMDKARDMLQPFVSYLSRELSDELVKLIRDRLEDNPQ